MRENYQAWEVNFKDFYNQHSLLDQLNFILRFAVLAPSGHNAQPWIFSIKEDSILLVPELKRSLAKSDPNNRQLFISLGCALENILIAADYYSFDTEVEYFPKDHENAVVKVSFCKRASDDASDDHLIFAIPTRHTNRNKYESQMPDEHFMDWLKGLNRENIKIDIIQDNTKRNAVADMSVNALIEIMDGKNFREELSPYLKSNFTKSKVGMTGHGHGMPDLVSLFASKIVRHVNTKRLERKKDENIFKNYTPVFCVLSSKGDDKRSCVRIGQLYERIILEAEKNNIKTAPLAAATQHEGYSRELRKLLQTDFIPMVILRIGYCKIQARPTPRMPQSEVTHTI